MSSNANKMKNLILNLSQFGFSNWWVEVTTSDPSCIYYFGPFSNSEEASDMCSGYVQDLINEGAQNINTVIKRCHPAELTKCYDDS